MTPARLIAPWWRRALAWLLREEIKPRCIWCRSPLAQGGPHFLCEPESSVAADRIARLEQRLEQRLTPRPPPTSIPGPGMRRRG